MSLTAADVMTPDVLSVGHQTDLSEVVSLMRDLDVSGLSVTDEEGRLLGVVAATDICAYCERRGRPGPSGAEAGTVFYHSPSRAPEIARVVASDLAGTRVSEVMTPRVVDVVEETPISRVASVMVEERVHRVLVTRAGELVGIVSAADLLGLVAGGRLRPRPSVARSGTARKGEA